MNDILLATFSHPMVPYCLPSDAQNGLDTVKFWAYAVAGAFSILAAIILGLKIWFASHRGGGHEIGSWVTFLVIGLVVVASATGIAGVFIPTSTDCIVR